MKTGRWIFAALFILGPAGARAQFVTSGGQTFTGQFGAGNATPRATLDVRTSSSDAYALWVSSQNGDSLMFVDGAGNMSVGVPSPAALLDIRGRGDDGDIGLQLRSGNSSSTYSSSQIVFAYDSSGTYRHRLVTRATADQYLGNDVDFFLWNSTGDPTALGDLEVLSLQGSQSVSSASVHIRPVGDPVYELVVSDGLTTGGGSVMAASVGTHSSRALKTMTATLGDADAEKAYEDVLSLKPATFRYKRRDGSAGPLVRGLVYEDSPESIRDERGRSLVVEARVANMEMALSVANRRIRELGKKIAAAEKEAR